MTKLWRVLLIAAMVVVLTAGSAVAAGLIDRDDQWLRGRWHFFHDVTFESPDCEVTFEDDVDFQGNIDVVLGATENIAIDASTTANTGTAGVLDYSYDTLTTTGVFMHIDSAFVAGGASGETIDVVVIDTDDDSDAAGTFTGLSVLCSDSTGSSAMVGIEAYGHDTDLLLGVADTDPALAIFSGDTTGSTQGGELRLELAADHDATIASYNIQPSADDLYIGPSTDEDSLMYDGGASIWNFTVGSTRFGVLDTVRGALQLSGQATGSANGGRVSLYTAADHDTTIDQYDVQVTSDDLIIGPSTNANLLTMSAEGDITLEDDITGGNAAARNEIIGIPKIRVVALGTMTNGSTESTSYMDDTPAGEWTQVTVTTPPTITNDGTYYRVGSNSLKLAWLDAAVDGDGTTHTIVGDNLEANESIGFWFYTTAALSSGDLELVITDDGGARTHNFPAVATTDVWTWIEIDISALAGGTGDVCSAVLILMSAGGATNLGDFDCYVDGMWKWDAADEEALGYNIKDFGVLDVWTGADAAGSANVQSIEAEDTDFIVHYESGVDFIVTIADHSANYGMALVAVQ